MSCLLDSLCGKVRLADCAKNDPPGQLTYTEDDLIAADLELSKDKAQRRARFEHEQARRLDLQARDCGLLR